MQQQGSTPVTTEKKDEKLERHYKSIGIPALAAALGAVKPDQPQQSASADSQRQMGSMLPMHLDGDQS